MNIDTTGTNYTVQKIIVPFIVKQLRQVLYDIWPLKSKSGQKSDLPNVSLIVTK